MMIILVVGAVGSVGNAKRCPRLVVNLQGCPQGGTAHQPALRFSISTVEDEKYTSAGVR